MTSERLPLPTHRSRYRRIVEAEQRRAFPGARAPSPLSGTNMVHDYDKNTVWKVRQRKSLTTLQHQSFMLPEVQGGNCSSDKSKALFSAVSRISAKIKTCSPCLLSLVKTEANVWENLRAGQ